MPRIVREAQVTWAGSSAKGSGTITAASSAAFADLPYSEPARVGAPEGQTSPEELLAAAHAGCFAMSLASTLTKARTPPARLEVHCAVTMDEVEGKGHVIVESAISVEGSVPGATPAAFEEAAAAAHAGCPLSTLIRATAAVVITAHLTEE
jgi:osmotically inducible protein OsmC